ncbi:MAG: gamma-glutamyltransferase [Actinomycetota bacterium]|nr:gamma-glutamyltransferase [Actinomycetota bacterium]
MRGVVVASGSQISADAGAAIADRGGNAVDAALAAALVCLVTEPGMCSLGGGGFVTIWPPAAEPVTIDGFDEMPGRGLGAERFGRAGRAVHLEYGGGVDTTVGYGSVATPGVVAACGRASERFGRVRWDALLEPARGHARRGFPLSAPAHHFLAYAHQSIYGWHPSSHAALHDEHGALLPEGAMVQVPHLAETLETLAERGPRDFYHGELARAIAAEMQGHDALLTLQDLRSYRAVERVPLRVGFDSWELATNPPPALGGAVLAAMVALMGQNDEWGWTSEQVARLAEVQRAVLDYRRARLGGPDPSGEAQDLLESARAGGRELLSSPSTLQISAAGSEGLACSITVSCGYGSGVLMEGTGIWFNNTLGELELNPGGFHALPPGARIPSNMAPSVARRTDGATLAIGSPGAGRITTAVLQVLLNYLRLGWSLQEAVNHPRLHVELLEGTTAVTYEEGLPVQGLTMERRPFPGRSMYFGGVQAAAWEPGSLSAAAAPRRAGAIALGGGATHT